MSLVCFTSSMPCFNPVSRQRHESLQHNFLDKCRQPVQIGTQLSSRTRPCWARRRRLQLQRSSQFLHQLGQYLLGFSLHWALSFRPLGFLFLLHGRLAFLLQGSISLSFGIALLVL